jgi:hypothetical protein
MKRSDRIVLTCVILLLAVFIFIPPVFDAYRNFNAAFPYTAAYLKFAILATFGESIGLRIRVGRYNYRGFGLIPRAIVWGFLGISIKMAFVIFSDGGPAMLATLGIKFPTSAPAAILRESFFSWLKLLSAFTASATLNLFFAPVFMTFHKITDLHIRENGGTLEGFFTPIAFRRLFTEIDWRGQWNFVFKKTIPLFWIPAQTLNFMLPEEYRVLVAALYSIVLGVLLSLASLKVSVHPDRV